MAQIIREAADWTAERQNELADLSFASSLAERRRVAFRNDFNDLTTVEIETL